jgi:hypothetical protein
MTTIIANREGMASDSQMTDGATTAAVPKFWRIRGWLIGGAGSYPDIIKMVHEMKYHKALTPAEVLEKVDFKKPGDVDLLLLSPKGKLFMSENGSYPLPISDGFAALGTGAQGALVALHLGFSLTEAIRVVKKVDPYTGGRIITRKL